MPERILTRLDGEASNNTAHAETIAGTPTSHNHKKRKRDFNKPSSELTRPAQHGANAPNPRRQNASPLKRNGDLTARTTGGSGEVSTKQIQHSQHHTLPEHKGRHGQPTSQKDTNAQNTHLASRASALLPLRKQLPIWSYSITIRQSLREKDIVVLVGETGSGKSTQLPQMLLTESWFKEHERSQAVKGVKVGGCIAITQPRRVAAISLARRVAEEQGTTLGGPKGRVGYAVRFDNSSGPETRIKYLTEGMLLQEMLRDPWLKQYSAVVVDEVHERGSNVDLVLGFLRRMVVEQEGLKERAGRGLKVCVMSATADVERLVGFFGQGEQDEAASGVKKAEDTEESEWEGFGDSVDEDKTHMNDRSPGRAATTGTSNGNVVDRHPSTALHKHLTNGDTRAQNASCPEHETSTITNLQIPSNVAVCSIGGRQYPVSILYASEAVSDFMDASLQTIMKIHRSEPLPGDILVFLTGQEVVENLEDLLNDYSEKLPENLPKLLVLPLFAALPQAAQQRVFQPAPKGKRKVILSTNIAETSITVSGVRFVVDCGKAKIKHFRPQIGLESLLVKPISKSSAIQRKGRAGREAPGTCYRLYTEDAYLSLDRNTLPEILRSDLSQVLLTLKARNVDNISAFPFLSPPPSDALAKALQQLHQLHALSDSGAITAVGKKMAQLPLSAPLSRSLIASSSKYDCLSETIDIIATLSVESLFLPLNSDEKKEAANTARADLTRREGDHLTLLATVRAYLAENSDRKAWCERRFVSHRAMRSVLDVRKQLRAHFSLPTTSSSATTQEDDDEGKTMLGSEKSELVLKTFLMGFKMNTARLMPDGSYRTFTGGSQAVAIHPASVLFGRKVECIMYNEFVFTNKAYARGVSAVRMDWVGEAFEEGGEKGHGS